MAFASLAVRNTMWTALKRIHDIITVIITKRATEHATTNAS